MGAWEISFWVFGGLVLIAWLTDYWVLAERIEELEARPGRGVDSSLLWGQRSRSVAAKEFIIRSELVEGKDIWTKARVVGDDLVPLLQADVSGYSLQVFDRDSDASETSLYTFTTTSATSVVYNTLQTGPEWTKDDIGFNFKHRVAQASFAQQGGHTYVLEYQLETTAWGPVPVIHHVTVISRHRV